MATAALDRTQIGDAALDDLVATIRDCTTKVRTMLANGMYDIKLASHLAWLTRQLGQILDRERKHVDRLTPQTIVARLRVMNAVEREHVARELDRMRGGGGKVLGG